MVGKCSRTKAFQCGGKSALEKGNGKKEMEGAFKEGELGRAVGGGEGEESTNGWQLVGDKGFSR